MGGAAGHLQHLYENLGLTFGEIKEVLANAAEGHLEKVSEKLDGMNLVFTWAPDGLKAARNGGEIKAGGLDAAGLAKRFRDRPNQNIEVAFSAAFKVLNQALGVLDEKTRAHVFRDGRRWYSMEIIYASEPNTINYDSNNIVFHGWPIYDVKDTGVEKSSDDSGVELLTKRIDQMQNAITQRDWQVRGPALLRLQKLGDGSILRRAEAQIDGAMAAGGVDDGDTVYDYLRNLFADDVRRLKLPDAVYKMVVERCATGTPSVVDIKRQTPKDQQATMQAYVKASETLRDQWMAPIESAIHFFAIEVLRGLHSTLISKSDEEVARLRHDLGRAIRTIEASGHPRAMEVLQAEMARLGNIENLAAAMEGIVFFFKGEAYKFTGAFAPAHQLMALFKYGRKDIPKMDLGETKQHNTFDDLQPVSLEDFHHVWPVLEADLEMIGLEGIELIGSTGKKQVMGDVDVAGRFEGGAPAFYEAAVRVFGQDSVRKSGGSVVSFKYLMDVPAFQVDVMVGDPKYLRWSRFGTSQDEGHSDFSPVKSVGRNVLLNVITRFASQAKWPSASPLERARMSIDFDRGLYEVNQTKKGKNDRVLKEWKTTYRYFVSGDPDVIAHRVFGKGITADQTLTFEGVVEALHRSRWKKLAPQIMQTFATEMRELVSKTPHLLGDDPEKVLTYIDTFA